MHPEFLRQGYLKVFNNFTKNKTLRKKKLILINPFNSLKRKELYDTSTISPPLSLGIIAALTPTDWDIEIIDENFVPFSFVEADLVGITVLTSAANRAYEIAEIYHKHNIPVVLGGIHVSMLTDEALKYCSAVVVGEAESIWGKLICDFNNSELKRIYRGEHGSMKNSVVPRRDLFHKDYSYANIQTSRGCPMCCEFCSVHTFNGDRYRERPVEEVLDELETIEDEHLFFVDDNIIGYSKKSEERALALFKGMVDRGIKKDWYCQASLNIADKEEVLKYAALSGCHMILIGIESEKVSQLEEVNKKMNLKIGIDHYEEAFQKIHSHGISVLGALVFGLDSDSVQDLKNRAQYAINSGIDAMQGTILTPLPGTGLYKRLEKENRLLYTDYPKDWEHCHFHEVSHIPLKMTTKELQETVEECWATMWDKKTIYKKMLRTLKETKNAKAAVWAFTSNTERHNTAFGNHREGLMVNTILKRN